MNKKIHDILETEVEKEILACGELEPGTREHAQAVESAATLLKAAEESEKLEAEAGKHKIEPWLGLAGSALASLGGVATGLLSFQALSNVAGAALDFEQTGGFSTLTSKQLVSGAIQNLMKCKR